MREPLSAAPFPRVVRVAGSAACQGALPATLFSRRPRRSLFSIAALALLAVACRRSAPVTAPGTHPIEELLARGRSPVEIAVTPVPGITPIPRYPVRLTNLSDRPVVAVRYTVLFYGPDGGLLFPGKQMVGFTNTRSPIAPGASWNGAFLSEVAGATRATAIVREVSYLAAGPGGERLASNPPPTTWKNPRHDVEVGALEQGGRPPAAPPASTGR